MPPISHDCDAPSEWLSAGQAAALTTPRISPSTLVRWAVRGAIASTKTPGGHRRFLRSDIEKLMSGNAVERPVTQEQPHVSPAEPLDVGARKQKVAGRTPGRQS